MTSPVHIQVFLAFCRGVCLQHLRAPSPPWKTWTCPRFRATSTLETSTSKCPTFPRSEHSSAGGGRDPVAPPSLLCSQLELSWPRRRSRPLTPVALVCAGLQLWVVWVLLFDFWRCVLVQFAQYGHCLFYERVVGNLRQVEHICCCANSKNVILILCFMTSQQSSHRDESSISAVHLSRMRISNLRAIGNNQ